MGNESQLIAALLGGFFGGIFTAAIAYMIFPKLISNTLRSDRISDPLKYVRVVAKYK